MDGRRLSVWGRDGLLPSLPATSKTRFGSSDVDGGRRRAQQVRKSESRIRPHPLSLPDRLNKMRPYFYEHGSEACFLGHVSCPFHFCFAIIF